MAPEWRSGRGGRALARSLSAGALEDLPARRHGPHRDRLRVPGRWHAGGTQDGRARRNPCAGAIGPNPVWAFEGRMAKRIWLSHAGQSCQRCCELACGDPPVIPRAGVNSAPRRRRRALRPSPRVARRSGLARAPRSAGSSRATAIMALWIRCGSTNGSGQHACSRRAARRPGPSLGGGYT